MWDHDPDIVKKLKSEFQVNTISLHGILSWVRKVRSRIDYVISFVNTRSDIRDFLLLKDLMISPAWIIIKWNRLNKDALRVASKHDVVIFENWSNLVNQIYEYINSRIWMVLPPLSIQNFNTSYNTWQFSKRELVEYWIIRLSTLNDWIVDRHWIQWNIGNEINNENSELWLNQLFWCNIEKLRVSLIEFLITNYVIWYNAKPTVKLIDVDLWSWDSQSIVEFRNSKTKVGSVLVSEYFDYVWIADKFYTNLYIVLRKFIKNNISKSKKKTLEEFLLIVSLRILNRMNLYSEYDQPTKKNRRIVDLYKDINAIKDILLNLKSYFKSNSRKIRKWWELLNEKYHKISEDCRKLLSEAISDPDTFFKDNFKLRLFDSKMDLNNEVRLDMKHVLLMNFQDIKTYLPDEPFAYIFRSWRADSHLDDNDYWELLPQLWKRLMPWWYIISDWIKQSYTRVWRFKAIFDFNAKYNKNWDFKIRYFISNWMIFPIFIQKALIVNGNKLFLNDERIKWSLEPWFALVEHDNLLLEYPNLVYKNLLTEMVRENIFRYHDSTDLQSKSLLFKWVHRIIDKYYRRRIRDSSWDQIYRVGIDSREETILEFVFHDYKLLESDLELITINNDALEENKTILGKNFPKFDIMSFSHKRAFPEWLNRPRVIHSTNIPNNDNLPNVEEREGDIVEIRNNLLELSTKYHAKLIHFINFWCFTDAMMISALQYILWQNFNQLVKIYNTSFESSLDSVWIPDKWIVIIWWNTSDIDDRNWIEFTNKITKIIIKKIIGWLNLRLLWICYGHQSIAKALGCEIRKWAVEFWPFPVIIERWNPIISNHLAWKLISSTFTRSSYAIISEKIRQDNWIQVLAKPFTWRDWFNTWTRDYPPVWISWLDDRISGVQMHPEIMLLNETHVKQLISISKKLILDCLFSKEVIHRALKKNIRSSGMLLKQDSWIHIIIDILKHFSRDLL